MIIMTDNIDHARIIMRASVYSTGKARSSKRTPELVFSWLHIYLCISGKVNYMVIGMIIGMWTLKVLPQGLEIISIQWGKLPMIIRNLQNMNWYPLSERVTGKEHKKRFEGILKDIQEKIQKSPKVANSQMEIKTTTLS